MYAHWVLGAFAFFFFRKNQKDVLRAIDDAYPRTRPGPAVIAGVLNGKQENSIKLSICFNPKRIPRDRTIYYVSYVTAIIGGLAAAYCVTGYLADQGATKGTIATCAAIAKSSGFIISNITAYSLFHLQNYKCLNDWYKNIKRDSKVLLFSGVGSSMLAATLRGVFHYALMLAAVEERVAMLIGYFGTGGLPTYLKYRSDLKNNLVEKNLEKLIGEQADPWQKF